MAEVEALLVRIEREVAEVEAESTPRIVFSMAFDQVAIR
jgi:hypothetical protein